MNLNWFWPSFEVHCCESLPPTPLSPDEKTKVDVSGDVALIDGQAHPRNIATLRERLLQRIKTEGFDQFVEEIRVINMLDRSVTDRFGAQWYDKGVLIVNFFDEGRSWMFRSDGGIHGLFVTCSLCGFKWRGHGIRICMTQRGCYR